MDEALKAGTNIRLWRKTRGLTLVELQDRIGMDENGKPFLSNVSISRIERGDQELTFTNLKRFAEALGCHVSDFIEPKDKREIEIIAAFRDMDNAQKDQLASYANFLKIKDK
jgi:transcriptional regulator with XRE-family HTH domain